jgi:hypoxanthine phosphoribosyltransferase
MLYPRDVIASRVSALAREISRDYEGTVPLLIGVLKGSFVFLADLMRELTIPSQVDFVRLASYGDSTECGGAITVTKDLEMSPAGRDLLVVEDIVDTGRTVEHLLKELRGRGPRSVKSCALLDKRHRREVQLMIDYVGFIMEEGFVVGYGLDWAETYRHLPDICVVEME